MQIRELGSQGLQTSQMGLGCMGMSEFYGECSEKESIHVLHRAIEFGVTFLDTADMYGPFTNEQLVGKALKGKRHDVTLATKFGVVRDLNDLSKREINGRPDYVRAACDASLRRLGTDVIDLYYLHRKDPKTPIEETVGAMSDLVRQGKIRTIGLSEVSVATLLKAHAVHPITAVQSEYSLWSREPEESMLDACMEMKIAFVAYSPLGRGFLTGRIERYEDFAPDDVRRNWPRFKGENFQRNLLLVDKIRDLANRKACTPSQLALAWVISMGDHIFPIPGTKHLAYLEENVSALNVVLTPEDKEEIDFLFPVDAAAGTRYPEGAMKLLNG